MKKAKKGHGMKREEVALMALQNAVGHESTMNYQTIIEGFAEKGIAPADVVPRRNVFTFNAWRALGRTVRRGEHGVKVVTWIKRTKTDEATGQESSYSIPNTTTVFHISQTDALPATPARAELATAEA